ncbi:MAG: branched-chain amino acid ABC transporter permease [Candidatus Binatia bacterium]
MSIDLIGIANVIVSGVLTGLVYGLMALGLSVIFGVARVVNFAHGEIMTIAMYVAVISYAFWNLDPFVALVPIAAVFFVFGYFLQAVVINRFITRPEHSQFILLLALAVIMVNALLIIFGPDARGVQLDDLLESIEIGPLLVDRGKLYAALVACGSSACLFAFFRFTRTGTAVRACADNWLGAKVVGIDVKRVYSIAFGIGSSSVAIAGCMMITLVDLTPSSGPAFTLLAFVIVIVGGLGSMSGALAGGVLIGVSEAMAGLFIEPSAKGMFSFALLIAVLIFRPGGLMGDKS